MKHYGRLVIFVFSLIVSIGLARPAHSAHADVCFACCPDDTCAEVVYHHF
jgi:hypothetical protein